MQNPFIRLKKYEKGENRATETLAACLVFSVEMRREFLNFLFDGKRLFNVEDAQAYVVSTQQETVDGCWVDLLIEKENEEGIVVEVKVNAAEDGCQIDKYKKWLRDDRKIARPYVFHLVKNPNLLFEITKHGGEKRHTWKKLYDYFKIKKAALETTDANLIEHFCNYLEVEEIVNTWNPKEIVNYRPEIAARKALHSLFEQVENRLIELKMDYETKIVIPDQGWPMLEIGMESWKVVFGERGSRKRVSVYYITETSGADHLDTFYFEIKLWDWRQRCDWNSTEPKLLTWIKILEQHQVGPWVMLKGNKLLDCDIAEYKFNEPPRQIPACGSASSLFEISTKEIEAMESDELVEEIFSRVRKHCDIVSQFK